MVVLKSQSQSLDRFLLAAVVGLTCFGLLAVFNASVAIGLRDFNDKFYFLRSQLVWVGIGLTLMLITSQISYKVFLNFSPLFLLTALVLLAIVLLPNFGIEALGAKRWFKIGPIVFQPTEFTKLAFILYLASFLAQKKDLLRFLIVLGFLLGLVIAEPDLGTAVIIAFTGAAIYFAAGASFLELSLFSILGILGILGTIFTSSYRRQRLLTFLNPLRKSEVPVYKLVCD